jgi:hypothetical protein
MSQPDWQNNRQTVITASDYLLILLWKKLKPVDIDTTYVPWI